MQGREKSKVDLRSQTWTTGRTMMLLKEGGGERSKGVGFSMKVINLALSTFESKVLMGHSDDEI